MMTGSDVTGDTFSARLRQVAPKGSETERRLSLVRSYISVQRYWLIGLAFPAVLFLPIPFAWLMFSMGIIQSTAQRSLSWARIAYTMPVTERDVAVTRWLCVVLPFPIFAFVVASVGAILGWLRLLDVPLYVCEALVWSHGICGMALVGAHVQRRTSSRGGLFTTGPSMLAPRQSRLRLVDVVLGEAAFAAAMMLFVSVHKYRTDLTVLKAWALLIGLILTVPSFLRNQSLIFKGAHEKVTPKRISREERLSPVHSKWKWIAQRLQAAAYFLAPAIVVLAGGSLASKASDVLFMAVLVVMTTMAASPFIGAGQQGDTLRTLRSLPMSRLRITMMVTKYTWLLFGGAYFGACLLLFTRFGGVIAPLAALVPGVFLLLQAMCVLVQAALTRSMPIMLLPVCVMVLSVFFLLLRLVGPEGAGIEIRAEEVEFWGSGIFLVGSALIAAAYCCLYWALGTDAAYARRA